jgi:uncharacterized protein (TIGR03437 family)
VSRLSVPIFGAMLLLPLTALAQQQINLSVQNIPVSATRLVAVVDGGAISGTLRASQDVPAGTGSSSLALGVPAGGPYRVRVIAFTAGGVYPAILGSGKATGVAVGSGATVNASVSLGNVSFAVDPTTPTSADEGASVTVKINITDPGDYLDGVSFGQLWGGAKSPTQNLAGSPTPGALKALGNGTYQFSTAISLPTAGMLFYYQFAASSYAFSNPDGTEAPLLLWPSLQPGVTPPQITLSSASGVNLTATNIPTNATRLIAVVDTGTNTGLMWASQDVPPGSSTSTFFIGLPTGTGYRVRVVSFVAGSTYPAVLRGGEITAVAVASGGTTNASVTLADLSGAVDPSSPSSVVAGQSPTIKINLTDPGDFLDGLEVGSIYTYSSPPTQNPSGPLSGFGGTFVRTGPGTYQFTGFLTAPQPGTLYYQFAASSSAFSNPNGQEHPSFFWPNLGTGAQAPQMTVVTGSQLSVSVGNIPSAAADLLAVVDGAAIGSMPIAQFVEPGTVSSSISVAVPPGGPYRIRVIATSQGDSGPVFATYVLRSGKATGISVSSGGGSASVTLADVSGSVDPSTPTSAPAGSSVTVKVNLTDPGDFLDGLSSGRLWYSLNSFGSNLPFAFNSGTLTNTGPGAYQFAAVTNLPTTGGVLYYQFGETAPFFVLEGVFGFTYPAYLVWPNVEAGVLPAQIIVTGPFSITNLQPTSAIAGGNGFTLTVNGTGFVAGSTVQWNGSALPTTFVTGTQLTTQVPPGLIASPGTATITISNPGGAVSNGLSFTINAQTPSISALNPSTVVAGGPAFSLTVIGSGFLPGATVKWTGAPLTTVFVSSNQLTASVSANLIAGQATEGIAVVNPGGGLSNTATFTITAPAPPAPSIVTLSPNTTAAGGPTFTLTVTGSGFVAGSVVQWNGSQVPTTYLGTTQLSASVPASLVASPGNASVTVVNPGSGTSNAATFTVTLPTPTISSVSPSSANSGGSAFPLTVSGSGFVLGAAVLWNGTALATSFGSGNQLTAIVPANLIASPGTSTVTGVNLGGASSNGVSFAVNATPSVIGSLTPNSISAGASAFTLTVNGSGFVSGSIIVWNGNSLATTYVSAAQVTAVVSANLIPGAGTVSVTVVNPDGTKSNTMNFAITPGLSIVTTSPLPSGVAGVQYTQTLTATGGMVPYKSWTLVSGSLPPGVILTTVSNAGFLNGIPTSAGTFSFNAQVTDSLNTVATKQFSLTIASSVSISQGGIVNSASYAGGSVAPGEIVTIFGSGLGPKALSNAQTDSRGYISTSNSGTQVLFDGVAAPIIYTQAAQVSVVVPYEVSGKTSTQVQVTYQGQTSNTASIAVSAVLPGIFTNNSSGSGQGTVLNQDGSVNLSNNPASVGSYVSVYATGEGQTNPGGIDGKPASAPAPAPVAQPVTATVGGIAAVVQYAGGSPGSVAGLLQVNLQIPQGVAAGNAVPVVINVGGQHSQGNVTLAIK